MGNVKLAARKSGLEKLEATAQALSTRKAVNEFEALVAACAILGEWICEARNRTEFMNKSNSLCGFELHGSDEQKTQEWSFDGQRAVHRSYSDRAELNVPHTNDSLLEVTLKEGKIVERTGKTRKSLQTMRVSKPAAELLAKYRDQIIQHNGK